MPGWETLSPSRHESIRKNSFQVVEGPFSLRVAKEASFLGFAIVVPVKVSKKAIIRNTIRRKIKAIILKNSLFLKKTPFIVFVREDVSILSPAELEKIIITLFKKGALL
jgi:ribonuclease P protein component